ncbi:MAG TPA: gamma-glutamyltransferase [Vicinamibacteria bacterium]|nr:gamma-glutamyltransferase [Vicinamibacteria bacterium]
MRSCRVVALAAGLVAALVAVSAPAQSRRTVKPVLHGRHWVAITGKPLAATAGATIFAKGGNAADAAAAMLAAACTMWDTLGWGGETQALVYDPRAKKVIGLNALGVAPTGATPEFFKGLGERYPPERGPLAAVTPGTPGGLIMLVAEWGRLSLADVLAPAIQMADGYPIEAQLANGLERQKQVLSGWPYSKAVFLPHVGREREAPSAGEVFVQKDLAATLRKLVEAEQQALAAGKSRREALMAAHDRFYKGDIAEELVRGTREQGGLITREDLARWRPRLEEPVKTSYKGIDVYKLTVWTQGPAMLQALNLLEGTDLKAMGYNSPRYIHTVYQAISMAFADRDFYYGDPTFPPEEPVAGLLSKEYARKRLAGLRAERNDPDVRPGDPYPFQGGTNPFGALLDEWRSVPGTGTGMPAHDRPPGGSGEGTPSDVGTTSVVAADEEGLVVSMTPSGAWNPAVVAGRTGIGLSQRMQAFVLDASDNPYNVVAPGKQPRVTLTPALSLKDGLPHLAFAVQGGDTQDQNLLQFFLNVVEFGMNVQQATEAANINSHQLRNVFARNASRPGHVTLAASTPEAVRKELESMGYTLEFQPITSGPINAVFFDRAHGTMWGGSSHHGEDYGIAW